MPSIINAGTGIQYSNDDTGVLALQGGGVTGVSVNVNGMFVKSVTTTQRNALTGTAGMIVFDTTLNQFVGYVNGYWETLSFLP
jgi:hypothetical protein